MADISEAALAKSNQLNATDIIGCEPVLLIEGVKLVREGGGQTVYVNYHGCNGRPWRVSKGMVRVLMAGWGKESDNWIGKAVQVFMDPSVVYAGKEVGGIRIKAMSDINPNGINTIVTISKTKREAFKVEYLNMQRPTYPQDKFEQALPAMVAQITAGKMSIEQVVAKCQQTGDLTPQQLQALEQSVPVSADDEEIN